MRTILFTHIPKTGSTSMRKSVMEPYIMSEKRYSPPGYWSAIWDKKEYDLIQGHFPYGMHYLYSISDPRYFTMLRNPIERAVSHYYFILACDGPSYEHPHLKEAKENTIAGFYQIPKHQNVQTRIISGLLVSYAGRYVRLNGTACRRVVEVAKRNLISNYEAFGIQERFQDSQQLFGSCLGVEPVHQDTRHKSTPDRPAVSELTQETRHSLRKSNALDMQLYHFAVEHFDRQ